MLDPTVASDAVTFKTEWLERLENDVTLFPDYIESLSVLFSDVCYALSVYQRSDSCANPGAIAAHKTLRNTISSYLNDALNAQAEADLLITALTAFSATTVTTAQQVAGLKIRVEHYNKINRPAQTLNVDALYNEAYNLKLAHTRTSGCFGSGYTSPTSSENANAADGSCLAFKRTLQSVMSDLLASLRATIAQSRRHADNCSSIALKLYFDPLASTACVKAWFDMSKKWDELQRDADEVLTLATMLALSINDLDCSDPNWADKIPVFTANLTYFQNKDAELNLRYNQLVIDEAVLARTCPPQIIILPPRPGSAVDLHPRSKLTRNPMLDPEAR